MESNNEAVLKEKILGISKGLKMGKAEIYAHILSFDKK